MKNLYDSLIKMLIEQTGADPDFVYVFRRYQAPFRLNSGGILNGAYLVLKVNRKLFVQAVDEHFEQPHVAEVLKTNVDTLDTRLHLFYLGDTEEFVSYHYGSMDELMKNHMGEII